MAILRERKGKNPGATYAVFSSRRPSILGRDESADVHLDDGRMSRRHARIVLAYGNWVIQDLKSSNGTLVEGKKVDRKILEDGLPVQVGNTLLTFHTDELRPPDPVEIEGAKLLETLREEEGVFVHRAYQAVLDREVRVDRLDPRRPRPEGLAELLARAAQLAGRLRHERIEPIVGFEVDEGSQTFAIFRTQQAPTLLEWLPKISETDLGWRLALLRSIVEVALERARSPILATPLHLAQIKVGTKDGGPAAYLAGCELPTLAALQAGSLPHLPQYASYLAPELSGEETPDEAAWPAAMVYSLGAIGYRLLTGKPPMGKDPADGGDVRETLKSHRSLPAAPANLLDASIPAAISDLLSSLLAKKPEDRPTDRDEILGILDDHQLPWESPHGSGETSQANIAKPDDDDFDELEIDDDDLLEAPAVKSPPRMAPASPANRAATAGQRGLDRDKIASRRAEERKSRALYNVLSLPIWIVLWAALFVGGWQISLMLFRKFLGDESAG